jgi:hypothetical protein
MIPSLTTARIQFVLATGICSLLLVNAASSQEAPPAIIKETPPATINEAPATLTQEAPPEKARALLDQVKKSEQDRQIAAKQTEIDRLTEDQARIQRDSNGLEKTIESTSGLTADASEQLATLTMESKRLEHELAVAQARIKAEKFKIEGLRALSEAQGKSLNALSRRAEQADARARLYTIEMEILQDGKQVPAEGREAESQTGLTKARKAFAAAAVRTESEERLAHEAMKGAAARMTLAETAATTAQRLADNDLPVEAPVAIPKAKPVDKTGSEKPAPVASGPKSAAGNGASSKPATSAPATTTIKAAKPTATPARR